MQQAHEQFVHVEAAIERAAGERQRRLLRLGAGQHRQLAAPAPAEEQRLKRLEHAAAAVARAARALGQQPHAPVVRAEDLEQQAGFAVRMLVQNKARLLLDAHQSPS